jgi:hypothetical protein
MGLITPLICKKVVSKSLVTRKFLTSFSTNNWWIMPNKHSQVNLIICYKSPNEKLGYADYCQRFLYISRSEAVIMDKVSY